MLFQQDFDNELFDVGMPVFSVLINFLMLNSYAYRNHLMITNEYYNHHPDYGSDLFSSIHLGATQSFLERRPYIGAWVGVIAPFILYRLQYFNTDNDSNSNNVYFYGMLSFSSSVMFCIHHICTRRNQ